MDRALAGTTRFDIGGTIRDAVVWDARHPADYMLLTALAHPVIGATEKPEYPPSETVDARELERAVTDYSRWLLTPAAMGTINPSPVPPKVIQRN